VADDRVNLSDLARRLRHNKGYIHKLKAKGILVFDEDGLLGVTEARAQIGAARDPGKAYMQAVNDRQRIAASRPPLQPVATDGADVAGEPAATSANGTYMRAKTMREAFGAKLSELDFRRRSGELVERRLVDSPVFEAFRMLRDRLMAMPATCAPLVIGLQEVREVEMVMADEQRRALLGFETQGLAAIQARIGGPR